MHGKIEFGLDMQVCRTDLVPILKSYKSTSEDSNLLRYLLSLVLVVSRFLVYLCTQFDEKVTNT